MNLSYWKGNRRRRSSDVRPFSPTNVAWVRCRPGYLCKFVIVFRLFPGASLFLSPQKPIKHLQYSNSNRTEDPPETKVVAFFLNIVIYLINNAITPSIVNRIHSIELSRTKLNRTHEGGKFLKKLSCCVGGSIKRYFGFIDWVDKVNWPP